MDGGQGNIPLEPGDRVVILGYPERREDFRATILGEVVYPGTYPITRDSTMLTDLVAMAGGFTPDAALRSAYVTRRAGSRTMGVDTLIAVRAFGYEDGAFYEAEQALLYRQEYVPADFPRLFVQGDSTADISLRGEDTVYVPPSPGTVYVYGQVVTPGHVAYVPGKNVEYYIKAAGGLMQLAMEDDIKVIKARTKQPLYVEDTTIEEGDYIWVPKDFERGFGYYLGIIAQSAAIISVAVSVIVVSTR
jgi:protein involved in polysaccharide export with SLBB domain